MAEKKGAGGEPQKYDARNGRYIDAVLKYSDTPETDLQNTELSGQEPKQITLPKQEYAELCSAIRTRYVNAIPKKGNILLGSYFYMFSYNKRMEKIVCSNKIYIESNRGLIARIMEK